MKPMYFTGFDPAATSELNSNDLPSKAHTPELGLDMFRAFARSCCQLSAEQASADSLLAELKEAERTQSSQLGPGPGAQQLWEIHRKLTGHLR